MGKLLGYHSDEQELDRPDLNKCPDCSCYFPQDECPLCGKTCPDNMRAGMRPAVKPVKAKKYTGRQGVVFVEWYHSWWFLAILTVLGLPLVSIILLFTSPHSKKSKIIVTVVAVVLGVLFYSTIFGLPEKITSYFESPVETSITREEYASSCKEVTLEDYYRSASVYNESFVKLTVKVKSRIIDADAEYTGNKYPIYYICTSVDNDSVEILIRNCLVEGQMNFLPGDIITIYGEGVGDTSVTDDAEYVTHSAPCINMAYYDKAK